MTTYDAAKAAGNATAVFWAEISGIPYAMSDGVVTAAHFGDAYTPTLTFLKCLQEPKDAFSRSFELLSGQATCGGFSLGLVDHADNTFPDGRLTWLFGADRSTIATYTLTSNMDPNDTTASVSPAFGGAVNDAIGYCELETFQYDVAGGALSTLTAITRSMYRSPATWHKGNAYSVYPTVTDHPTRWAGRIVSLYQSYMDGDGSLCSSDGTTATARAEAHVWRGVLRDIQYRGGVWTIRCDSLDTLLKRQFCRAQPEGVVQQRVTVFNATDEGVSVGGAVCFVRQIDPAGLVGPFGYYVAVTPGLYSREEFLAAVEAAADAGVTLDTDGNDTWQGTLKIEFTADTMSVTYHTSPVPADVRYCAVDFSMNMINAENGDYLDTHDYWTALGKTPESSTVFDMDRHEDPAGDTSYTQNYEAIAEMTLDMRTRQTVVLGPADAFGGSSDVTSFAVDDAVAIISDAGVSAARVRAVTPASNSMVLKRIGSLDPEGMVHTGSPGKPIRVRKAFYGFRAQNGAAGPGLAESTMRLLLGTGQPAFNHANYDLDDEGMGIAFPHLTPTGGVDDSASCIDILAFLGFFGEAEAYVDYIEDFIYEPTEALKWLRQRVGFLGGFLTVRNGQLTVRRGVCPLYSDAAHTVSEDELIPGWNISLGQVSSVDGVQFKHNWSLAQSKFMYTTCAVPGDQLSGMESQNRVEWEDRGIWTDSARLYALALSYLYDFSRENWIYEGATDRMHWDIEPGQVVRFSDDGSGDTTDDMRRFIGLPNPSGTRGYESGATATRMVVLSASSSPHDGTTQLRLVNVRARRTGYSPSAWIEDYATVGGKTTLTCTAQLFSPTADGVDVSRFTAGDKVRILSVNPTQAGADPGLETGEAGLTIESINATASTITLTGSVALVWPSPLDASTQCAVLVHDDYETASQTTAAQEWAYAGDSSGDIDDGGDKCFTW